MDTDSGLGDRRREGAAGVSRVNFAIPAWFAEMDLFPVPPFSLGLAAYELLPDGHKRCFSCKKVQRAGEYWGTRGVCKTCSNAQARHRFMLQQLQKKARYQVLVRRHPELAKPSDVDTPARFSLGDSCPRHATARKAVHDPRPSARQVVTEDTT